MSIRRTFESMKLGNIFPFILLLVCSCSTSQRVSLMKPRPHHIPSDFETTYQCLTKKRKEVFLGDSEHFSYFKEMINRLKNNNIKLRPVEKIVLWGFSQALLRPNQVSLDSHNIIVINYKNRMNFFSTKGKNPDSFQFGFFETMRFLLKKHNSQYSLKEIINLFDENYPSLITTGKNLSDFLLSSKEDLQQNKKDYSIYFRGEDLLLENEIYRRPRISNIYNRFQLNQKSYSNVLPLILQKNKQDRWKCNFDFDRYESGKLDHEIKENSSYYFGFRNSYFSILVGSQTKISWNSQKRMRNILPNAIQSSEAPICIYSGAKSKLVLASLKGKDPEQTLSHLNSYKIESLDDLEQVYRLTNFARHLILKNPTRILYESQRGTEDQLEKLNSLNIPIYHAKSIGEISGILQVGQGQVNFLLDDRSTIRENCTQ